MDDMKMVISGLSEGVEIIRESLQCAICLELLKNPVCTRCSHSFCRECIMTVINTNRIAHCPLCNKTINRRSITGNEKVGTLVEKAQNLIGSIGKDTGYDITSHIKLPSSTREAVIASPQFHPKKQEMVSIQHEASLHKISKPAVTTSKEQWLKRYKGAYPGKRDSVGDNIDLLSISQAEPVYQSFLARDAALLEVESKVDKLKVPPIEKVEEWLQRNVDEFDKAPVRLSGPNSVTVTADVHRGLDDESDLLSVSQQRFYIAPRKADVGALRKSSKRLQCAYDEMKQASNEKRIFTSRCGNENNTKLCQRVKEGQNDESDPYEFISSQKTRMLSKKKRTKKKGEVPVQTREVKSFKIYGPSSMKGDNQNPIEKNNVACNSPPVSDFTFVCPVEINDTFDNFVANTHKPELKKMVKTDDINVAAGDDNSDDICLFKTPLEVPVTSQNNGGSSTESMSDVDFSSGSSDEWGESNKVKQDPIKVSSRRTRSSSYNIPKESHSRNTSRLTAQRKSSRICSRRNEKLEFLRFSSKEADKQKLHIKDPVKTKPLSPVKKFNLNIDVGGFNTVNMKHCAAVCNTDKENTKDESAMCLSTDKAQIGKENVICPVTHKCGVENKTYLEDTAVNTTVCSRSPGWSRISQSRKDFEKFKKPALKALNVSGGEVCTSKKHVTSVSEVSKKPGILNDVMSPLPSIDDSDSSVGIPLVAFDSPDASNRVKMMSKIVMNLESQIGPNSSTANMAEVSTETFTPHAVKDPTLKKCTSFGSDAVSECVNAPDRPNSCQRKELIQVILSSLENGDQLEHQCNESNEQIMSGITKLHEGETEVGTQLNDSKDTDDVKNPAAHTVETVLIVQEPNSTMEHEEVTENIELNQDNHNKDDGDIKGNPVADSSEPVFIVQESNSTMAHEEATENIECSQDNHINVRGSIIKNISADKSRNNVLMVQGSCSTKAHEGAEEHTEYNQAGHNEDNGDITKNHVFDIGKTNILKIQDSNSTTTYVEAIENIQQNHVVDQNIVPTERDYIKINISLEPMTECGESASPEYRNNCNEKSVQTVQSGNISREQLIICQGEGKCDPANSLLAASSQDVQAVVLSEKCNQKLPALSSDIIINSKAQESSFFMPCFTKELQLQPKMSTEPMDIATEGLHQIEIQSRCNSSVGCVNSNTNKICIPFIKCGRLAFSRTVTKFVLLGSLAPRLKNVSPETVQELRSADSLGMKSGLIRRESLGMTYETGTQTSPGLLDDKSNPTPHVNPKSVRFTTTTGTINRSQEDGEDFIPDSCDGTYVFPCAVPLPHSFMQQTLVNSNKCSETGDSLTMYGTSEPLNADKYVKDNSAEDRVNMYRTAILGNQCEYNEPIDYMDHRITTSQSSLTKMAKIQQIRTSNNAGPSPELPSNLVAHAGLNASVLQKTNNGKAVSSIQDQCVANTNQSEVSDIQDGREDNGERNAKSQQQNAMTVPRTDGFARQLLQELHSEHSVHEQNNCGNTSAQKNSSTNRSSKASRQLTFSPTFIPKLSDPNLDVNKEDGERNGQKLHKKSYKRIRVASVSSNSVSAGSDSNDMSDSENREIKKPRHTSLRKALDEGKDNEVLVVCEDAGTSQEVIDLLTPSEETSSGHLTPDVDDKSSIDGKWLEEDVPNSEELMARVMANIEADLVETRKRKKREGDDSQEMRGESPTLFTPPPFVADSEEPVSRVTCELVVSDSEAEHEKRPFKKSSLGNTTVGNETESLSTQQRNKIQADIHNLEAEIKECEAQLQNVIKNTSTGNAHLGTECGDSQNESEDVVEPTPKGQITSNKCWDSKTKDDARPEIKEDHFQRADQENLTSPFSAVQNTGKRTPLHNPDHHCILPGRSPSVINSTEIQCKQSGTPKYQSANVNGPAGSPKSKQTVLQLLHKNMLPTSPVRSEKADSGIMHVSSMPANCSNTTKALTPAGVTKPALPQPSPQTSTIQKPLPTKLCFVCSGLHSGLISRVKLLSKLLGAEFSNKFEPHTTHLVVKASDTMTADKTLKYLSAVVKKTWIVSFAWVNACLQARKLVPEDEYEMLDSSGENGPHRSRTSSNLLYGNFEFCCIEPFTDLSREQLEGILKDCGAIIVNHPEKFSLKAGCCCVIIIQMNAEREEECKELWERYGVLPVGHEWVFECIGRYRIIPIWSFLTCSVSEDHVRTLGYPEDALASDDDDETVVESQV